MPYSPTFSALYRRRSQKLLDTALNELEAYHSWRAFDPGRDCPVDRRYAAMPALTKKDIREHFPRGFLLPDRDIESGLARGEIALVQTSGSIDRKVTNIWNQKWWDASERASWKLNSYANRLATGDHPEAILVNPMNVGIISNEADLPLEKRRLARFLYLNEKSDPLTWTTDHMDRMIEELDIFQPVILEANPSFLAKLCRYINAHHKKVYQPGLIVLTYEYPASFHYRQIRQAFHVPVASSYGTTETGYVFMQCEEGKFHQNIDFCRVDFQPFKTEHGGPFLGRILVTTFDNPWYYILRFDVGDLARIDESGRCACGRNHGLIMTAIEGRSANTTLTSSGRLVTLRELDIALSVLEDLDEFRLEQTASGVYELHLVSPRKDRNKLREEAVTVLKNLYGANSEVKVIFEEAISPDSSGKYTLAGARFPIDIEQCLDKNNNVTITGGK
jgi:phenylacetate-coenzyme A ligase PaaK-like adenylate-forming protein